MARDPSDDPILTSIRADDSDSREAWLQSSPLQTSPLPMGDMETTGQWSLFDSPPTLETLEANAILWEHVPLEPSTLAATATTTTTTGAKPKTTKRSTKKEASQTEPVTWADVFSQYQELMAAKGQWDARRFNKTALAMLHVCIRLAKSQPVGNADAGVSPLAISSPTPTPTPTHRPENALDWSHEQEALSKFRDLLLNSKEIVSEQLIERVIQYIQQGLPPLLTADERKDLLLKRSLAFVSELSPQLSIKISPVIRSYVARLFDSQLDNLFAEIRMPEMPLKDKSLMYGRMLSNFIDNPTCVSLAATNKQLLGHVAPVDMWFLTFFACVTTRRMRGDNLLQLGCVGKSSVGKSLLFESILLVTAHQLLSTATSGSSDGGCGRFSVGSKNTIVFHDINIATLTGVDLERVKSLARTENTVAKVHSSTTTVSPMFVFYTSNERLFRHIIPPSISGTGLSCSYSSQADSVPGKKRVSEENLEAVRARFLELFVFKVPLQDQRDLDTCGTFSREHFILGTYDRALDILEKYQPLDFHSPYLPAYVISALLKNVDFMEEVMCQASLPEECPRRHRQRVERLRQTFNVCCV